MRVFQKITLFFVYVWDIYFERHEDNETSKFILRVILGVKSSADFFKVDILVKIVKFTSPESLPIMKI